MEAARDRRKAGDWAAGHGDDEMVGIGLERVDKEVQIKVRREER